jgi:predicted metal-dependent HD superfamily phosphohydrolase
MDKNSALINEMIAYYSGDPKRINHFLKVFSLAKTIAEMEQVNNNKKEILETAAIVHDIGIKLSEQKYNSSAGKYQQIEGPALAEDMLNRLGYSTEIIARVSFLVGHHHTYPVIDDIDFHILVEADFFVNIFEDSMDADTTIRVRDNYFKTNTGIAYLEALYL